MVGQIDKKDKITRALEVYILKDREKQRLEDEAEAEKMRKKKEEEEKKSKEESEYRATKDKLADVIKRHEQLQQEKVKLFEHLKKIISDPSKNTLQSDDVSKLLNIGLAVSHLTPPPAPAQPIHPTTVPVTVIPRVTTVSVNSQYKATTTTTMPVQVIPTQKRNRSPSPTVYRSAYGYKQAAGPHPFQKLEDHRNHDYNRSYLYKPGNAPPPSSNYSAFYPPGQSVAYTHPSATVHGNASVYSFNSNRESIEVMHKSQSVPPPPTPPQHSSLYTHRSPMPPGPPPIQSANHVSYLVDPTKSGQSYPDDKYYIVRPGNHVSVHGGVIPIQQPPPVNKHGSITAGYPVRPVATQMGPQAQLHVQPSHGGHHGSQQSHHGSQASHHSSQSSHHPQPSHLSSQSSHHSSQSSHHSSQSSHHSSQPTHHSSQPTHHSSQPTHHSSLSHHSPQTHHPSSQSSQIRLPQSHQSHHQQSSVHYPTSSQLHHTQSHGSSQSQQSHASPQPPVSVQSHHSASHHQHIQQLHVQSHHQQVGSHHQLMGHHTPSSIHHTSSQHLQQAMHHQQALQQSQSLHPSHSQSLHHPGMTQPHIQQHISHQSQSQGQQSQPTSVVTSQAYANQISAIQGGSRVVYSQPNIPH